MQKCTERWTWLLFWFRVVLQFCSLFPIDECLNQWMNEWTNECIFLLQTTAREKNRKEENSTCLHTVTIVCTLNGNNHRKDGSITIVTILTGLECQGHLFYIIEYTRALCMIRNGLIFKKFCKINFAISLLRFWKICNNDRIRIQIQYKSLFGILSTWDYFLWLEIFIISLRSFNTLYWLSKCISTWESEFKCMLLNCIYIKINIPASFFICHRIGSLSLLWIYSNTLINHNNVATNWIKLTEKDPISHAIKTVHRLKLHSIVHFYCGNSNDSGNSKRNTLYRITNEMKFSREKKNRDRKWLAYACLWSLDHENQ